MQKLLQGAYPVSISFTVVVWQSNNNVLFLTEEAYSHDGLQTRKLGQTPLSVDQPRSEH